MSGPAILKLSAWGARILKERKYTFDITVNWTNDLTIPQCAEKLKDYKQEFPKDGDEQSAIQTALAFVGEAMSSHRND
jgi:predicted flavoprotein YhiN